MRKNHTILMLTLCAIVASCSSTERSRTLGDSNVSGKTIAQQVCETCHGSNGNSISPQYPKLAGQSEEYITQQLKNFENHLRTDRLAIEIMSGMSRDLSEQQTKEIAAYFSSQTLIKTSKATSVEPVKGKEIYLNGIVDRGVTSCAACHGPEAKGQFAYPRLAGQHKEYLVKQLHVFKDTQGRPNTPMEFVIKNLSEKEIDQVSTYLSSLD